MNLARIWAILLASALVAAAAPALAQQAVDTSHPIVVKQTKPKSTLLRFEGEVLHATSVAITVRSKDNERIIRTFSYSPQVQEQMQQIIDQGGYQYGDKIVIRYQAGSEVAQKIKGKPSKPL